MPDWQKLTTAVELGERATSTRPQSFESWWNETGQETLYALNTLTDDDAKKLAEIAWEQSQAECRPRSLPSLEPVINWLEKGCDPKDAAKELRIYAASMKDDFAAVGKPIMDLDIRSLRKQNAALKAVVDAWNNVESEPIGYIDAADLRELCNGNERQYSLFTEDKGRMVAIYAAPVRTKDLTDAELNNLWIGSTKGGWIGLFRTVIAADRERNK